MNAAVDKLSSTPLIFLRGATYLCSLSSQLIVWLPPRAAVIVTGKLYLLVCPKCRPRNTLDPGCSVMNSDSVFIIQQNHRLKPYAFELVSLDQP